MHLVPIVAGSLTSRGPESVTSPAMGCFNL
jgi:hypothetical protein